jgi:uncharacterized protein YkwD
MANLDRWRAISVASMLVLSTPVPGPSTKSVNGTVRKQDRDVAVTRTEIRVDHGGSTLTTDSGDFAFPLSPPLKVGFPATFRVTGWVIIDPCVLARGRMYLPDPEAESVAIKVLRPGDKRLLSGRSVGCLLEESASRFEPSSSSTEPYRVSLRFRRWHVSVERWALGPSGWWDREAGPVSVTGVGYHGTGQAEAKHDGTQQWLSHPTGPDSAPPRCSTAIEPRQKQLEQRIFAAINIQRTESGVAALAWNDALANQAREHSCRMAKLGFFSHADPERGTHPERLQRAGIQSSGSAENIYQESGYSSAERPHTMTPARDEALPQQASQLGFKPKQLASAINRWAHSVRDPYEKGLAAIYQHRYAEATHYITESITSSAGNVLKYVPLARAEYEQGNYSAAEAALRKVLAVHSNDPLVTDDLAVILGRRRGPADVSTRAVQFWMEHPGHRSNILDRFFDQTGVGVFVSQTGTYFVTQLFNAR